MNGDDDEEPRESRLPAPLGAEARRAERTGSPSDSPPPQKAPASPFAAPLLLGALLLFALAAAGVYLAKRQLNRESEAIVDETPSPAASDKVTIEIPEPAGTPLAGETPAADKIFNSANESLKAGAEAIGRAAPSAVGSVSELPPAPQSSDGNAGLQDAAKDAAKLFAPQSDDRDFNPSTDNSEVQPPTGFSPSASSEYAAGISDALQLGVARLAGSLETERRHTERQAAEIERLNAELAALKAQGSPAALKAKAALQFNALAEKVKSGEPYRRELEDYEEETGDKAAPAIEVGADAGLATLAALQAEFPAVREAALAAARRESATGPLARLGANFASLVRLRPAAPIEGASPGAIFSRAEARLAADDLGGALAELGGLTGAAREEAVQWRAKAAARLAADAGLSEINRALIAALEAEPSEQ